MPTNTSNQPSIGSVSGEISGQYRSGSSPRTKSVLAGAVVVLLLAVLYWLTFNASNTPKVARALSLPVPVGGYKVEVSDISNTIGASGTVQEHSTITVNSLVAATVKTVLINIGDIIKKDQPLIDIDQSYYKPALVSAQQQEISAKITVEKDASVVKATAVLKRQGLAEEVDVQTAASNLATAAQAEAQAEEVVAQDQRNLDFTQMKSPVNGIVITRSVDPGDNLTVNTPVFSLGDLDTVYFEALAQEDDLPFLTKGAAADVVFSSLPTQTFHGFVEKIDPTVDSTTRTFDAYVAIKNPGLVLKPGVTGFGRITIKRTGLSVPQSSVMNQFGETASVFVVDKDSRAVLTPVHLGLLGAEGNYEIVSGLKEGDVVVSVGTLYLQNNERVHVTFPPDKS